MSELSPQRKKVVVLAAAVACMGGGIIVFREYPRVLGIWVGIMIVALVFTVIEFAKLKGGRG